MLELVHSLQILKATNFFEIQKENISINKLNEQTTNFLNVTMFLLFGFLRD